MAAACVWLLCVTSLFAQPPASATAASVSAADEVELLRLLNQERQRQGRAALVMDEALRTAARRHSARMAARDAVEHQVGDEPSVERRLTGLRFDESGENVARAPDVSAAHYGLMRSPGHRANILQPSYNAVGIGVVRTARGLYVTQDFAHRLPELSVVEVEQQVGDILNELRRAAGAAPLTPVAAPELRERACQMAASDRLDPHRLLARRVSHSAVFTVLDLADLPASLASLRMSPAHSFSVGACYRTSASYAQPVFWVAVAIY